MRDRRSNSAPFKSGIVTLLDPKGRRARVKFDDEDGAQSFWLRVLSKGSKSMRHTHMPVIGEQVACLVDWRGEDGVIIGAVYSDEDASPSFAADVDHIAYSDGTIHEHDPQTKINRQLMKEGGTKVLGAGAAKLMFRDGKIIASSPIVVGAVPDFPLRKE